METWVFGAILTLVGFLVIGCSFGPSEFGLFLSITGVTSAGFGSVVFFTSFKKWVENL